MKKVFILVLLLALLALLLFFLFSDFSGKITGKTTNRYFHSLTKAICNQTHCQDYEIFCNGEEVVSRIPITGAIIRISDTWEDPREEIEINNLCG